MRDQLTIYFTGERQAGMLLVGIGIIALAAAAIFLQPRWGLRSFAITLALMALIEIAIGLGLYLRTGPQVADLLARLAASPAEFAAGEGVRMARVQRNFVVVQYVEVAVIILAAGVALAQKHRIWLSGIALGLLIHAALLLAFDLVAERRGAIYLNALQRAGSGGDHGSL